jgi:hypothetical protein
LASLSFFFEMSELRHVLTHPHLYLPFAGLTLVIAGAAAAIASITLLLLLEPGRRLQAAPVALVCIGFGPRTMLRRFGPIIAALVRRRDQRCSNVLRKRSIRMKYSRQVVGWYAETRLRISAATGFASANMQMSVSQPGPSAGSR